MSRPCATASRLPCTRLPTITDAGPTDVSVIQPDELPDTWCCCSAPVMCVMFMATVSYGVCWFVFGGVVLVGGFCWCMQISGVGVGANDENKNTVGVVGHLVWE